MNQSESASVVGANPQNQVAKNLPGTISKETQIKNNKKLINLLSDAYEAIEAEEEWVHLGPFGSQLTKLSPSFDPRNYGYAKLSSLVQATGLFEINKASKHIRIKLKA